MMPPPQANANPPAAFHFAVSFDSAPRDADCWFSEVSGIAAELELESVVEGGESRFMHPLPTSVKHQRLVLKRGVAPFDSRLVSWCREVLEGGLGQPIKTQLLRVSLLDETGQPLRTWSFANAFPVKWEIETFNATKNEVAMDKLEISYLSSKREA